MTLPDDLANALGVPPADMRSALVRLGVRVARNDPDEPPGLNLARCYSSGMFLDMFTRSTELLGRELVASCDPSSDRVWAENERLFGVAVLYPVALNNVYRYGRSVATFLDPPERERVHNAAHRIVGDVRGFREIRNALEHGDRQVPDGSTILVEGDGSTAWLTLVGIRIDLGKGVDVALALRAVARESYNASLARWNVEHPDDSPDSATE